MRRIVFFRMNVMTLIAAPADIASKDLPLRENVRRGAIRFRKTQDDRDREQFEQMPTPPSQCSRDYSG